MNVYFISGLGADGNIFRNVRLPDGYDAHYIDWISHEKNETLKNYAYRMAEHIDTTQPFIIVGLSFGGMLGSEIIQRYPSGKLILISSVASRKHLPVYYRMAGKVGLQKVIPVSLLKSAALMKRLFTAETREQKTYLRRMIREVDVDFIRWGLDAIVKWKGELPGQPYLHMHGSKDAILPKTFCEPTHVIKGGGHLMVLTHAHEINRIIARYLSQS